MNNNTNNDYSKELIPVGMARDITGEVFGRLTVLGRTHNMKTDTAWLCRCECGVVKPIRANGITDGRVSSCGCLNRDVARERMSNLSSEEQSRRGRYTSKDITGKRFGKLVAVRPTDKREGTNVIWQLKCDCGNEHHSSTGNLSNGGVQSCGCLHKEVVSISLVGNRYGRLSVIEQGKHIGDKIAWVCKCECGNITEVSGDHLKSGGTRSCGCIREEMVGTNHPNYNANKTDEERLLKRYVLGKHTIDGFRKAVYKRDEYTCQLCGQVGGSLNAHHLDGWNWAKDKRFDVDNGVTLCEGCHISFHSKYGKGYNTKEQFKEFKHNTKLEEYTKTSV